MQLVKSARGRTQGEGNLKGGTLKPNTNNCCARLIALHQQLWVPVIGRPLCDGVSLRGVVQLPPLQKLNCQFLFLFPFSTQPKTAQTRFTKSLIDLRPRSSAVEITL